MFMFIGFSLARVQKTNRNKIVGKFRGIKEIRTLLLCNSAQIGQTIRGQTGKHPWRDGHNRSVEVVCKGVFFSFLASSLPINVVGRKLCWMDFTGC